MKYLSVLFILLFSYTLSFAQKEGELLLDKNQIVFQSRTLSPDSDGVYNISDDIVDVISCIRLGENVKNGKTQEGIIGGYTYDADTSFKITNTYNTNEGLHQLDFSNFNGILSIKVGDMQWCLKKETHKSILSIGENISLMDSPLKYDSLRGFYYFEGSASGEHAITHLAVKDAIRLFVNNEEIPLQYSNHLYSLPNETVIGANDSVVVDAGSYQWKIYPFSEAVVAQDNDKNQNTMFWLMLVGDILAVLAIIAIAWFIGRRAWKKSQMKKQVIGKALTYYNDYKGTKGEEIMRIAGSSDEGEFKNLLDGLKEKIDQKRVDEIDAVKTRIEDLISRIKEEYARLNELREQQSMDGAANDTEQPVVTEQSADSVADKSDEVVNEVVTEEAGQEESKEDESVQEIAPKADDEERIAKIIEKATEGVVKKEEFLQAFKEEKPLSFDNFVQNQVEKYVKCSSQVKDCWEASKKESKGESGINLLESFVRKLDDELRKVQKSAQQGSRDDKATFDEIYNGLIKDYKEQFGKKVVELLKERKLKGSDFSLDTFCANLLEDQKKANSIRPEEDVLRDYVEMDLIPDDVKDVLAAKFVAALNEKITEESHKLDSKNATMESLVKELLEKHIEVPHNESEVEEKAAALSEQKIQEAQLKLEEANQKCAGFEEQLSLKEQEIATNKEKASEELENLKNTYQNNKLAMENKHRDELENLKNNYQNNKLAMENKHKDELEKEQQKLVDEQSKNKAAIEELNQKHEEAMAKQKSDAEEAQKVAVQKVTDEKDTLEMNLNQQIEDLNQNLQQEKTVHAEDVDKLRAYYMNYVGDLQNVMSSVLEAIKKSANNSSSDKLKSFVNERIVENDELGMESFFGQVKEAVQKSDMKSVEAFREELKPVLLECFDSDRPTWIDILTRLYLYSKVNFVACQFVNNGMDLCEVGAAFHAVENLFDEFGIDLAYPELFEESFDRSKYEDRALRDIDSYVEGIAAHVNSSDAVVDIYSVGYLVDGELKKKPVVSSFS